MSPASLLLTVSCVRVDDLAARFLPREYIPRSHVSVFISTVLDFLFVLAMLCELHVRSRFNGLFFISRLLLNQIFYNSSYLSL
jgi:uncharacterized membrane protein